MSKQRKLLEKLNKKTKQSENLVDWKGLFWFLVILGIIILSLYQILNVDFQRVKQEINNSRNLDICIEIDKNESPIVKRINDFVYINGKQYKYLDIKIRCEMRKATTLNLSYANKSINFSLYKQ